MNARHCFATLFAAALACGVSVAPAQTPRTDALTNLEGLGQIKSKRLDTVYVRPGADFRGYTKVMLDSARVEFSPRWMRDINPTKLELIKRTSPEDAAIITGEAASSLGEIFADEFKRAGYAIVSVPGPDVLRIVPRVTDLYINAPNNVTTSITTRSYTLEAGEGTLVLEVSDSRSGALLARAVDPRVAGSQGNFRSNVAITSTASNRGHFRAMFENWAQLSIGGLEELKEQSPVAVAALTPKP